MKISFLVPVLITAALLALLTRSLFLDRAVGETPMVGRPVPVFDLPPIQEQAKGVSSQTLAQGEPVLVNFFASWCVPCRAEHGQLMAMAEAGDPPIYGINYLDSREDGQAFLDELGDPYEAVGFDARGRVGIDLGVRGVPETFVIDGNGVIVTRHLGPRTPQIVAEKIQPALEMARR